MRYLLAAAMFAFSAVIGWRTWVEDRRAGRMIDDLGRRIKEARKPWPES